MVKYAVVFLAFILSQRASIILSITFHFVLYHSLHCCFILSSVTLIAMTVNWWNVESRLSILSIRVSVNLAGRMDVKFVSPGSLLVGASCYTRLSRGRLGQHAAS